MKTGETRDACLGRPPPALRAAPGSKVVEPAGDGREKRLALIENRST